MTDDSTLIEHGETVVEWMRKSLNEWLESKRFDTLVVFDIGPEDLAGLRAPA